MPGCEPQPPQEPDSTNRPRNKGILSEYEFIIYSAPEFEHKHKPFGNADILKDPASFAKRLSFTLEEIYTYRWWKIMRPGQRMSYLEFLDGLISASHDPQGGRNDPESALGVVLSNALVTIREEYLRSRRPVQQRFN